MGIVHVVGAGLSGLSCALHLLHAGRRVAVHEAAGQAGGRCRSLFDRRLDRMIDNGSHLILGANEETFRFLAALGTAAEVEEIAPARFPFVDLRTGQAWCLAPGSGRPPFWLPAPARRVPDTRWHHYLDLLRLAFAGPRTEIRDCVRSAQPLYERLVRPLSLAVLNTEADDGSAALLGRVIRATFLKGEQACRPQFFPNGLSSTLIDPAVRALRGAGAPVRTHARLRAIARRGERAERLDFTDGSIRLDRGDSVVLAVTPGPCGELLPGAVTPRCHNPIVNAHYRLAKPAALPSGLPFLGLIGGSAQWLFTRGEIVSVTVSAASGLVDIPESTLARSLWTEIAPILGAEPEALPPSRIIKERRATFAQTPKEATRRPAAGTELRNLFLAGDWTDTGLPATIEGSLLSGRRAARLAQTVTARRAA